MIWRAAARRKHLVAAVLDHGGAGVAEELLDQQFLGEAEAAEELDGVAGHLEGGLGAEDLGGDGVAGRPAGMVVAL